jgi:hypothetical protein
VAKAIERLGESEAGPAYLLLGLLSRQGWFVGVTAGFAGGILVVAEHPQFGRVEKQAASVVDIAADLADECAAMAASGPLQ